MNLPPASLRVNENPDKQYFNSQHGSSKQACEIQLSPC